jgi:hypothetical protein
MELLDAAWVISSFYVDLNFAVFFCLHHDPVAAQAQALQCSYKQVIPATCVREPQAAPQHAHMQGCTAGQAHHGAFG